VNIVEVNTQNKNEVPYFERSRSTEQQIDWCKISPYNSGSETHIGHEKNISGLRNNAEKIVIIRRCLATHFHPFIDQPSD